MVTGQTEAGVCATPITMAFQLTITRMGDMALVERMVDQLVLEIVQEKITCHVQETCKWSFDYSCVASLEERLAMVVLLAWLKEALMRGIIRKKLLEHPYNTYTTCNWSCSSSGLEKFLSTSVR